MQFFQILVASFTLLTVIPSHAVEESAPTCNEIATDSPLYPKIEPYETGRLKVSDLHEIYYEEVGNPNGQPILFIHGGPGAGFSPDNRRFFDPAHYRVILFDQRGSGKSTPHAELRDNTTWDLVDDIEKLRNHLGIEKWMLFGGSWGSTLSLVYAESHPDKVQAMILRGIFLCRKSEVDWFYQYGAGHIFPDAFQKYLNHIPENERHDMVAAYYRRMTSTDPKIRLAAAREWSMWEGSASYLKPKSTAELMGDFGEEKFALAFGRIESHFFYNRIFFKSDNHIIENVGKIAHIPTEIVHGLYDMVCPIESAILLKNHMPSANLHRVLSGHAASEPETTKALVNATNKFKSLR